MRISDWSSDVCSSDLVFKGHFAKERQEVDAHDVGLRFHISGIAFAQRDDLELAGKRFGGILEAGAGWRSPTPTIDRRAGIGDSSLGRAAQQRNATASALEIGSASCRERVCKYV